VRSLDVRDLLDRPGASRRVATSEPLKDVSVEMASVPEGTPVGFDVMLESVVEGILVSGTLSGTMEFRCARCLKEFSHDFNADVRELFAHTGSEEEDHYPIADGEIDLEPMARDALLLQVPFSPLCRADCLGLCPRCGGDRNLGECSCGPEVDPRWAALSSLRLQD
jgi:uncharacterized protein